MNWKELRKRMGIEEESVKKFSDYAFWMELNTIKS